MRTLQTRGKGIKVVSIQIDRDSLFGNRYRTKPKLEKKKVVQIWMYCIKLSFKDAIYL